MPTRKLLWKVKDPRGLVVCLANDIWQEHVAYRPEIKDYLDAVALTVKDPDAIYFDPKTTALRTTGAQIYWYYRSGLTQGKYAGNYVAVVVKFVAENSHLLRGYVESALLPNDIMRRLAPEWTRT